MVDTTEALVQQAYAKRRDGDTAGALEAYRAAAAHFEQANDAPGQAHCLRHLGDILRQSGRGREAHDALQAAETLYRTLDDPLGLANTLRQIALLHHGSFEALPLWREARDLYRHLGIEAGVAEADCHLG